MRTARECLLQACYCERMAHDLFDPSDRRTMLVIGEHWRTLARTAKPTGSDDDAK